MLSLKDFTDYYDLPYEQISILLETAQNEVWHEARQPPVVLPPELDMDVGPQVVESRSI